MDKIAAQMARQNMRRRGISTVLLEEAAAAGGTTALLSLAAAIVATGASLATGAAVLPAVAAATAGTALVVGGLGLVNFMTSLGAASNVYFGRGGGGPDPTAPGILADIDPGLVAATKAVTEGLGDKDIPIVVAYLVVKFTQDIENLPSSEKKDKIDTLVTEIKEMGPEKIKGVIEDISVIAQKAIAQIEPDAEAIVEKAEKEAEAAVNAKAGGYNKRQRQRTQRRMQQRTRRQTQRRI
jgi:hypothetical protein